MELSLTGAFLMVKNILFGFVALMIFSLSSLKSEAGITVSVGTATWQEKIPVIYSGSEVRAKTSFTGLMFGIGLMVQITQRWSWDLNANMIAGLADIQKLDGAVVPRRNVNSIWLPNRILYSVSDRIAWGPNILTNFRKIDGLNGAVSTGAFIDFDYRILEKSVLTHSIGTISDSKELAYSVKYTKRF